MRYFLSVISRPYSNKLVAVFVLHAMIRAQKIEPSPLFKSMNIDVAAKKQKGRRLYPRFEAHVKRSTYCPCLLIRFMRICIPMHPVNPNP